MKTRTRRGGFTLVELMVVIAIIALLGTIGAGITMWALGNARKTACADNLKKLYNGAVAYRLAQGRFPIVEGHHFFSYLFSSPEAPNLKRGNNIVTDLDSFICPATADTNRQADGSPIATWVDGTAWNSGESSYAGPDYTKMGTQPGTVPETQVMGADDDDPTGTANHSDGLNVVTAGGRTKFLDDENLKIATAGQTGFPEAPLLENLKN